MKKQLSGIIRCLNILQSQCGKKMCTFRLAGDEIAEVVVLPLCYEAYAHLIEHGAHVFVEAEVSRGRIFAAGMSSVVCPEQQ